MSDVFEGPGWWMASDGKWYPPDRHPDENYRARFSNDPQVTATFAPVPETSPPQIATVAEEETLVQSSSGLSIADQRTTPPVTTVPETSVTAQVNGLVEEGLVVEPSNGLFVETVDTPEVGVPSGHSTLDAGWVTHAETTDNAPDPDTSNLNAVRVSKRDPLGVEVERPEAPPRIPDSVVGITSHNPDLEIELNRRGESADPDAAVRLGAEAVQAGTFTPTTDLVAVRPLNEPIDVPLRSRVTSVLIFLSGIALIVGSFLTWVGGEVEQSGWDRGEGIATVIAGIVGAAAAGPIFVGFRHSLPRAAAIIAGLVGLVVVGIVVITTLDPSGEPARSVGTGAIVVIAAAAAMLLAGISDPGERGW